MLIYIVLFVKSLGEVGWAQKRDHSIVPDHTLNGSLVSGDRCTAGEVNRQAPEKRRSHNGRIRLEGFQLGHQRKEEACHPQIRLIWLAAYDRTAKPARVNHPSTMCPTY
ncbi:hypothetical protein [Microvirga rosea]|uniref:hypothetical protein n=1 Tax=Microvirga rosea TaxID=2715425 RepID=UPI001D0B2780|nr:hypothetical protein [Microvirga rosea]